MKIRHGCIVELTYELKDGDGDIVESSKENGPMTYLHGYGEVPEGLEKKLEGIAPGTHLVVELGPGEAFGDHNPDGIISVPREQFPADAEIVPGDWISVQVEDDENSEGESGEMEMRVVDIAPEAITLDANHPLAGQKVTFDLQVESVRVATPEEIEEHENADAEDEKEE